MENIRLLVLQPGSYGDPIRCNLQEHSLSDMDGKYDAISYVWGESGDLIDIECDGHRLPIKTNLYAALQTYRYATAQRFLWADAICINQFDHAEKGYQVRRMADIYQTASHVLCWLGDDDEGIAQGCFDLINVANQKLASQWQESWTFENLLEDLELPFLSSPEKKLDWGKFASLLECSWFERLWVVQEAGLARQCSLFWGGQHIELYKVVELAAWSAYSSHAPKGANDARTGHALTYVFLDFQSTYDNVLTWRRNAPIAKALTKLYPKEKQLYVDLLYCARSFKVTDQRDVIYSSLGSPLALAMDGKPMVTPDYTEPLDKLLVRATLALLQNSREAPHTLLRVVHTAKEQLEDDKLPTWVPRWTTFSITDPQPLPFTHTYEHRLKPYCASGDILDFKVQDITGNIIQVIGFVFDTLTWASVPLRLNNLRSDIERWDPQLRLARMSAIETMWHDVLREMRQPREQLAVEFSLLTVRGRPSSPDYTDNFLAYCEHLHLLAGSDQPSPFPKSRSRRAVSAEGEWATCRCRDRSLACTVNQRLALVPQFSQPGDSLCIIQGLATPVVLRKTSRETFKLVGDAYVNGVMDGELLQPNAENVPKWRLFSIC